MSKEDELNTINDIRKFQAMKPMTMQELLAEDKHQIQLGIEYDALDKQRKETRHAMWIEYHEKELVD